MEELKTCRICNNAFPAKTEHFYKNKSSKDGLHPWCKKCSIERSRQKQLEKHDEYKEYWRNRFNDLYENDPAIRERQKSNQKKRVNKNVLYRNWQQNNPEKIRGYNLKRNNHKKHEISKEEWEYCKSYFNNSCAYCGLHEEQHKEIYKQQLHKEHVDHLGSNKIDNCVPSCKSCNGSKHTTVLVDWYNTDNSNYTHERLDKIHKWLNGDYELKELI